MYILNSDKYYIFQPSLLDDPTIPLYYRMNLHTIGLRKIFLPRINEVDDVCVCMKAYTVESIQDVYEDILKGLGESGTYPEISTILPELSKVYKVIHKYHPILLGYMFDRLSFNDKCKLLYGYFHGHIFKYDFFSDLQELVSSFIIYKLKDKFIINNSSNHDSRFGFVLSYNSKPCFYEYYQHEFVKCNDLQIMNINNSIKLYKSTPHYKKFTQTNPVWGYTILRNKGYKQECVLKFVQPSGRGKTETTKYPPGPGNVSMENNRASRMDMLLKLIDDNYHAVSALANEPFMTNKKNISCLLELVFRYNGDFFHHDKIWLKYY